MEASEGDNRIGAACPACGRANPSGRERCLYCGAETGAAPARNEPARALESWEKGFDVIALGSIGPEQSLTGMPIPPEVIEAARQCAPPFPLARLAAREEAVGLADMLNGAGCRAAVISDEELGLGRPNRRLRGIGLGDGPLRLMEFNSEDVAEFEPDEIAVIVSGSIFENVERSVERRNRGESKTVNESSSIDSYPVIDVYAGDDSAYRILPKGFDFSCLGGDKGILAIENMKRLRDRLREIAGEGKFDDGYDAKREVIDRVWPIEAKRTSDGLQRAGLGRADVIYNFVSGNLEQFNRYSRMRRLAI